MNGEASMDKISTARLANTIEWANKACREALDLALDAPNNPGIESLEEPADVAAEALRALLEACANLRPRGRMLSNEAFRD
jgi:hypothetical protein